MNNKNIKVNINNYKYIYQDQLYLNNIICLFYKRYILVFYYQRAVSSSISTFTLSPGAMLLG